MSCHLFYNSALRPPGSFLLVLLLGLQSKWTRSCYPPATRLDLLVSLDSLGLLHVTVLLFSGSSTCEIYVWYFCLWDPSPSSCTLIVLRTIFETYSTLSGRYLFFLFFVDTFSWTRRTLKPAGYFCLPISSLRLGCLGRPQETILVGYFPPRSPEISPILLVLHNKKLSQVSAFI